MLYTEDVMGILQRIFEALFPPKLTRKDCPHWNVEKDGQCNLLPDPEPCIGYDRCRATSILDSPGRFMTLTPQLLADIDSFVRSKPGQTATYWEISDKFEIPIVELYSWDTYQKKLLKPDWQPWSQYVEQFNNYYAERKS